MANFEYKVNPPQKGNRNSKNVLLLLSLSEPVVWEQYEGRVPEDATTYEIANSEQQQQLNWLVAEDQLEKFGKVYQEMLSTIQRVHGQDAVIYVLAAVPTAVAIEVGRLHRPNAHSQLEIYNCVGGVFSPALTLRKPQ
ncbi:SAVED domain-containing protein [Deinococcus oregonensis]|uniref:SAVED domain-containing protein n=1 Tax=Deinococcus oregonensis TaxID=1805970 RepID=A0ABV6AWY7_9DEIO